MEVIAIRVASLKCHLLCASDPEEVSEAIIILFYVENMKRLSEG